MEAASLLGVSPATLRVWARKGELPSHATPGGHRRFAHADLALFARQRGMTRLSAAPEPLRILLVEDDPQFALFIQEALGTLDPAPEVETAREGFEAGRRLQRFQPNLILLDLMLPGLDGFAICQGLRRDPETRRLRVIAMTGYDTPENVTRILDAGAEACLSKPFRTSELLGAILGARNRSEQPAPSLAAPI
ncbi:response regulator [Thiocystis violacea]|uniref:response regulator n=1 Tax=Thiocystis violacea TaxID=13725 RepID=UPI00190727E6|nr:response regulator [Thiocystis violacea]